MHKYWFGITWTFKCPQCHKVSVEKALINSTTEDQNKIQASINRQKLSCQRCKAPLVDGVEVEVHVLPGTGESLLKMGYLRTPSSH